VTLLVLWGLVPWGCGTNATDLHAVGIRAEGCRSTAELGSGLLVGSGLVLTSAHVVAGADTITVLIDTDTEADATIVGFDPFMDLAYLRTPVEAMANAAVPVISSNRAEPGATGWALVFRDGAPTELDVEVRRRTRINTEDIYVEGATTRPGFELTADIELGDSGGAVVVDSEVIGVLWARTRDFDDARAYAIDVSRARDLIDTQLTTALSTRQSTHHAAAEPLSQPIDTRPTSPNNAQQ